VPRTIKVLLLAGFLVLPFGGTICYGLPNDESGSGYFELGNDKLYYHVTGNGFPLVLVSGGSGMDSRQWDLIAPELVKSYRVIRYDPRGIGKSDNPTAVYSDADDLARLLDHLELKRVGLIGLSSAGGFVLEFAIQYPDRITGLIAAAPFIPGFEFSDAMRERLTQFNQAVEKGREPFLEKMLADPHFIPAPLNSSIRIFAREVMGYNFDKGADFDITLPIQLSPPLIQQLSNISSPVLLLAGELDHPEVLRRNKYLLARIELAEEKIIENSGHNGPLENPDAFLMAVKSFLQTIARQYSGSPLNTGQDQ
jgi:pimeloyl-ACP methyl ester carboxylesterase